MDKRQIEEDIAKWFRDRLKRATLDAFERFEIMGIAPHDGAAQVSSELVILTARMLAEASGATPEICGRMFAQTIEGYRKRKERKQSSD